jgi:hypothetical protein
LIPNAGSLGPAEKVRSRIIGSLEKLQASNGVGHDHECRIETVISKIREIRDGAFARLSRHPVLQVLLLPFGGVRGMVGIELLSRLNF